MPDRTRIGPPDWLKGMNDDLLAQQERGELPFPLPVLVLPGRRSGTPRLTPLTIGDVGGARYVVCGFPAADWVRNLRAADGHGVLRTGDAEERVRLVEVSPADAEPVLRAWPEITPDGVGMMRDAGVVADVTPDAVAAAAGICPVYRVEGDL